MKTSEKGLKVLMLREGFKHKAYQDTKGIWTIGVGHTGPEVQEGLVWTDEQVLAAFAADVKWAEDCVNKFVKAKLTQNQFDALVSFVFNIGCTRFPISTVCRQLNINDYRGAALAFLLWTKPPEIMSRRKSEYNQFLEP